MRSSKKRFFFTFSSCFWVKGIALVYRICTTLNRNHFFEIHYLENLMNDAYRFMRYLNSWNFHFSGYSQSGKVAHNLDLTSKSQCNFSEMIFQNLNKWVASPLFTNLYNFSKMASTIIGSMNTIYHPKYSCLLNNTISR